MKLNELSPSAGATHSKKRVGRGIGSGHGVTATRGSKGQKARAGGNVHPRFEGGQLPLVKRMPHRRGFKNPFRVEFAVVNVERLEDFQDGDKVDPIALAVRGFVKDPNKPVKILGDGELTRKLDVTAHAISASAKAKIEAAGGSVTVLLVAESQTSETPATTSEEA